MMFLKVFILSHLTGDFLLQTNNISKKKSESASGVFTHALIILCVKIVFMSVFGLKGVIAGIISAILHFILDFAKLKLGTRLFKSQFIYFILDQIAHILIIFVLYNIFDTDPVFSIVPGIETLVIVLIITYVITVAVKILLRDIFAELRSLSFFLRRERLIDAMFGLSLYFMSYIVSDFIIRLLIYFICISIYMIIQKKMFFYKEKHFPVKTIFITLCVFFIKTAVRHHH